MGELLALKKFLSNSIDLMKNLLQEAHRRSITSDNWKRTHPCNHPKNHQSGLCTGRGPQPAYHLQGPPRGCRRHPPPETEIDH